MLYAWRHRTSEKPRYILTIILDIQHVVLGCPTFWRLLRKNKLASISDRIFVADFKNDVIFQLWLILKCHLADFMQILTYLENDKS